METRELFKFDPFDLNAMRKLMELYGDSEGMFWGSNENGERVSFSIFHDKIITSTYQDNDWVRVNTYHWDGTKEEAYCKLGDLLCFRVLQSFLSFASSSLLAAV